MPKQKTFFTVDGELWKLCTHCDRLLPFNIIYFCRNPRQSRGLSYVCKNCENKRQDAYNKKKKQGYIPPDKKRNSQPGSLKKKRIKDKLKTEIADLFEKLGNGGNE